MKSAVFRTQRPRDTAALGFRLGRLLRGSDVVCLLGNLGSGKTTLAKGAARGAGFRGLAASPTFTLARVYRGRRWRIYHLDLYRVPPGQAGDIGLEDYLDDPGGFCLIEWPQAGAEYYPKDRLEIRIAQERAGRRIRLRALGPRSQELLLGLGLKDS